MTIKMIKTNKYKNYSHNFLHKNKHLQLKKLITFKKKIIFQLFLLLHLVFNIFIILLEKIEQPN